MSDPSIVNLIDCKLQENVTYGGQWSDFVNGGDGFLYGIPFHASKVLRLKIKDKSMKEIGPDLGDGDNKYFSGV